MKPQANLWAVKWFFRNQNSLNASRFGIIELVPKCWHVETVSEKTSYAIVNCNL